MALSVLQDLNVNRLRSVITVASIVVGVVALISTTLVGLIAQDVFIAKEEQRTARSATLRVEFGASPRASADAVDLWRALQERFEGTPANAVVLWRGRGDLLGGPQEVTVVGVLGRYTDTRRLPLVEEAGSTSGAGADAGSRQVLVNEEMAETSLGSQTLTLPGLRPALQVDVVGVVADAESAAHLYLPLTQEQAAPVAQQIGAVEPLLLVTVGEEELAGARDLLDTLVMRSGVSVQPDISRYDTVSSVEEQLGSLTTLFSVVAMVALILSALGILNIGLASVGYRTKELAIRRSLGARPRDLFGLVLGSALGAGLLAALVGLGLTWLVLRLVLPELLPQGSAVSIPNLPASTVLHATGAAMTTAVVGAVLPAWRASRIEISSVLRD